MNYNFQTGNQIHSTAIIESSVQLGSNNYVGPYCYIKGKTVIGDNNRFESYCAIGSNPEDKNYFSNDYGQCIIGNNCTFKEFTTVNIGTKDTTRIGDNVIMGRNSCVYHDCIIEDNVTLSGNSIVGGHGYVMEGVNLGLNGSCHQCTIIPAYSMIGMGGVVTKKSYLEAGKIYVGNPVKYLKDNKIGLERNNISSDMIKELQEKYEDLKSQTT